MNRKVFSRSFEWCYFQFFPMSKTVKFWLFFASFLCHGFVSNRTHLQHGPLEPPWNFVSECLFQKNFLPHPWPPERSLWVLTFPFFAVFLRPCFCFLLMQPNRAFRSFAIGQSIFGCARLIFVLQFAIVIVDYPAQNHCSKKLKIGETIYFSRSV